MKLSKGKLRNLIKEEVQKIVLKETSDYVIEAMKPLQKQLGSDRLLAELTNSLTDTELLQALKDISKKYNIDMKPQNQQPEIVEEGEKQNGG